MELIYVLITLVASVLGLLLGLYFNKQNRYPNDITKMKKPTTKPSLVGRKC